MESEFPPNSHAISGSGAPVEKSVKRVVTGEVIRRKKPIGKRFADLFVSEDSGSVAQYVFLEVFLPAAKDMVADMVSQGVERMIFGEVRSASRRTGTRPPSGHGGYVAYNRYASQARDERRPPMSSRARATHNFEEIVLATRREAEEVLDGLYDLLSKYNVVSVSDLYDLVGETSNHADEKWGWTDLKGSSVTRVRDGYLLELPQTSPID